MTIAAYGVGSTILQVVTIPAMGMSMAVSTLVGQNIGAGNLDRASRITFLGTAARLRHSDASRASSRLLFAPPIVSFFIPNDAGVIAEGARFIRIMAWPGAASASSSCIVSAFRASGNMLIAMVIAMVSQWMVQFPLAYVLAKHTSLHGRRHWWSFPATNVVVAIVSICWFLTGSWKRTRLTEEDRLVVATTEEAIIEEPIR